LKILECDASHDLAHRPPCASVRSSGSSCSMSAPSLPSALNFQPVAAFNSSTIRAISAGATSPYQRENGVPIRPSTVIESNSSPSSRHAVRREPFDLEARRSRCSSAKAWTRATTDLCRSDRAAIRC
jgi:hypothetical protein